MAADRSTRPSGRRRGSRSSAIRSTATERWNKTESYAGFAEGTYELVDNLFLTLGGRYTTEKRRRRTDLIVNGRAESRFPTASTRFNKFTYNGSLRYQFTEKSNVYVRYGTGFKSGIYTRNAAPVMTRPEEIKALEGGIKSDPVDWLRVNLSAFYYDYTDLQVTARDPLTTSYIVQNAANAELYGGELEMTLVPVQDLTVRGSVAYNHARYKDFPQRPGLHRRTRAAATPSRPSTFPETICCAPLRGRSAFRRRGRRISAAAGSGRRPICSTARGSTRIS